MNSKAFTLIELMIVIAIMGIALFSLYLGFPALFGGIDRHQQMVEENTGLTLAYGMISNCLKDCRRISSVADGRILFDNDQYIALENFGKQLRVNGKVLPLVGRTCISEIEHVSDTMFITRVDTGFDVIRVIWQTGVGNE